MQEIFHEGFGFILKKMQNKDILLTWPNNFLTIFDKYLKKFQKSFNAG